MQGIVAMEGRSLKAIVNDREVYVGDRVGRSQVLRIERDGVLFRLRGRTFKKRVGD